MQALIADSLAARRIALGATRGDVEALIFRQGFLTAATGLAAGLAVALLMMRIMRRVLVGLDSGNLPHVWIEVGIVSLTAAFACWLPARRAAKIDPCWPCGRSNPQSDTSVWIDHLQRGSEFSGLPNICAKPIRQVFGQNSARQTPAGCHGILNLRYFVAEVDVNYESVFDEWRALLYGLIR
jgi:hypothetical protein